MKGCRLKHPGDSKFKLPDMTDWIKNFTRRPIECLGADKSVVVAQARLARFLLIRLPVWEVLLLAPLRWVPLLRLALLCIWARSGLLLLFVTAVAPLPLVRSCACSFA